MKLDKTNLRKEYWRYIIPSLIAQVVFTLYTMVDALMVARGVSAAALAGVNIAMPYVTVLWAIAITFAVGTSTIVARLMGEGSDEDADRVFSQVVWALTLFSIIIGVLSYFGADAIGSFLGASASILEYTVTYIRTVSFFTLAYIMSYVFEILSPVDGHPRLASVVVTISAALNCVLDYVFIFDFHWGVWGAAFATGLSQGLAALFFVFHFLSRRSTLKFRICPIDWKTILQVAARGLPSGISDISPGLIIFISVYFISRNIGEDGLIANSTLSYASLLLTIAAVAVGQGCQPMISYFNGAKRPDIIRKILRFEVKDVAILGVASLIVMIACAPAIVRFFIPQESPELIAYSIRAFRMYMSFGLFSMYNILLAQYTTALERPLTGSLIMFLRASVLLVLGTIIMMRLMGPEGIWLGLAASEAMTLVIALILFKHNHAYLND